VSGGSALQASIEDLYRIAVTEKKSTSTVRLKKLADFCVAELSRRGVEGASAEDAIDGWIRTKDWDVAQRVGGRVRLAISLKSMLANLGGSVPNRTDDLLGEAADIQLRYPETVIGYVIIMNEGADTPPGPSGKWIRTFEERLAKIATRRAPLWVQGLIEAAAVIRVDFTHGPKLCSKAEALAPFFDRLVAEYKIRLE
jgi:hypothetical protein